jgi:phage baseplate assembly protein W
MFVGGQTYLEGTQTMSGIKAGDGYWIIDNPNDEAVKLRYKKALAEALALFENAVKLTVRAKDQVALASLKQEAEAMFDKAENTFKETNRNY